MTREKAKREIDDIDFYLQHYTDDYSERSHDAMMMAIRALSQEPCDKPCDDAISRADAQTEIMMSKSLVSFDRDIWIKTKDAVQIIRESPSVTPSRRYGAWIGIDEEPHEDFECCVCGKAIYAIEDLSEYKYCPNCGAEMESEE